MIDLHLHTTASDGLCTPEKLIQRAYTAGITTISVTDHDTMEAIPAAAAAAARQGLEFVPGIEVTSVLDGHDVHLLGYWLDAQSPALAGFLQDACTRRIDRAMEMGRRLDAAGVGIDVEALVTGESSPRSVARPLLARALVKAGHVATVDEAFDRFLSRGCPAYVPNRGPSPAAAISAIRQAGGIASLAHPGTLGRDDFLLSLCAAGLDALEVYHSAHDLDTQARYLALARALGLEVSGGSDFHGEGTRRSEYFGRTCLPPTDFEQLRKRAGRLRDDAR
jgi:predicted metal-dependent phosphoesterase TrpH